MSIKWKCKEFHLCLLSSKDGSEWFLLRQKCWNKPSPWSSAHFFFSVLSKSGKRNEVEGNLFEIITASEVHYVLQAATSAERTEWIKAIQLVSRTGKWKTDDFSKKRKKKKNLKKRFTSSVALWKGISAGFKFKLLFKQ